jgi:hypothetical protein
MTPAWASDTAERLNKSNGGQLPSRKFQFVKYYSITWSNMKHVLICCSIWKPLRGPVRDWPLALCDPASVGGEDLRACDLVYSSTVVENFAVHANAQHSWYYLSEQTASEAWVFVQADSTIAGGHGKAKEFSQTSNLLTYTIRSASFLVSPSRKHRKRSAAREYRGSSLGLL